MFSKSKKVKRPSSDPSTNLPAGAEAALWSIVEVIPDPRNHLALTKDPTAEVRLTRAAIDDAMARAATVEPAPLTPAPAAPTSTASTPRARAREAATLPADTATPAAPTTSASPGASWLPDELPVKPDPRPAWPTRRSSGVKWSADTAEVRLPAISTPPLAETPADDSSDAPADDQPKPDPWAGPAAAGDASVHPIEAPSPAPTFELPVHRRYARGA